MVSATLDSSLRQRAVGRRGNRQGETEQLMPAWKVKLEGVKRPLKVEAEYYRIDQYTGALYFRNKFAGNEYPIPVLCVAAGKWITITKVER
jgi:hypothetical protein